MKLAILGTDAEILRLAAVARKHGHEIEWLGDVRPDDAAAIGQYVVDTTDRSAEWELLLDRGTVDGVLVGAGIAGAELRAEQLKRLVAEAMPLLVVHPIFLSVLPYYEIDMVRRETGAIVQHFNPLADHPMAAQLANWVRDTHPKIGTIHQLTAERRVANGDRATVLAALARDIELLAAVGGDVRRVSAIGPATLESSFASLQAQMTAANVPSLRWSVGAVISTNADMQLTLLGEHGTVALRELRPKKDVDGTWQLETVNDDHHDLQPVEVLDPADRAIARFEFAVAAEDSEERAATSTWDSATRAMEVVDAVELSLQKGRTIEVVQQQLTERLAFRGTMAALGCGLLLVAFLAIVVVAILGGAEGLVREKIAPSWPLLLLAVLAFFLLMQAVPFLAQKPSQRDGERKPRN